MKYRRLGTSNLRISPLCLGTMMFGDQTSEADSGEIIAAARDRGVNFIDTADVYSRGRSEEIVGRIIARDRHHWVLATKAGNKMSEAPNEVRWSRRWLMQAAHRSLERLGTDHIDILYLHRDFEQDNLEEAMRALDDLIRAGHIRYYGLSNFRGWRIAEAVRLADSIGMPRPTVCQPYYNLLNRMPEVELLPACAHYGLGVVPYSPVARGVLTGKYLPGESPVAGSRAARGDRRMMETEWREESLRVAQELARHAQSRGLPLSRFAVAWVLANRHVSSVIAGPRTLSQWLDYFGAETFEWTDADEQAVDALVVPGHASTPGYHDPSYPFHGRMLR